MVGCIQFAGHGDLAGVGKRCGSLGFAAQRGEHGRSGRGVGWGGGGWGLQLNRLIDGEPTIGQMRDDRVKGMRFICFEELFGERQLCGGGAWLRGYHFFLETGDLVASEGGGDEKSVAHFRKSTGELAKLGGILESLSGGLGGNDVPDNFFSSGDNQVAAPLGDRGADF